MNTNNEPILRKTAVKPIYSITPFTLLDYPDKTACILWFAGCNMRCLYCYNPDIVLGKGVIDFEKVFTFLASRKGLLDGVVLSGGECTIHKDIIALARKIKAMGFAVKIDTNGSKPLVLKQLIEEQLVDYVALDFKSIVSNYKKITKSNLFKNFEKSLLYLIASKIAFEVRTTVHSDLISEDDFKQMVSYLETQKFEGKYYVQHFVNNVPTLSELTHSQEKLKTQHFSTSKIQVVFR